MDAALFSSLLLLLVPAAKANDVTIFGAVPNEPVILEGPEKAKVGDLLEFNCQVYGDKYIPDILFAVNENLVSFFRK